MHGKWVEYNNLGVMKLENMSDEKCQLNPSNLLFVHW